MNIRRFAAEDSRTALRLVREALGGDAVIVSNRSTAEGVEILAVAAGEVAAYTQRATQPVTQRPVPASTAVPIERSDRPATSAPVPATPFAHRAAPQAAPQQAPQAAPQALAEANAVRSRSRLASLFDRTRSRSAAPDKAVDDAAQSDVALDALTALADDDASFTATIGTEAIALSRPDAAAPHRAQSVVLQRSKAMLAQTIPSAVPRVSNAAWSNGVPLDAISPYTAAAASTCASAELLATPPSSASVAASFDPIAPAPRALAELNTNDAAAFDAAALTREIRAMKSELTEQLAAVTWTEAMRRQPGRMKLMQDLVAAGFSPLLARHIQQKLPDDFSHREAREWVRAILQRNLACAAENEDAICEGGVFALVGPTGVGKTTTIAKLAARFAFRHGVGKLALITTDGFRIGAQDQLRIYGKILGAAVHSIHDETSLASAVAHFADKRLILIDTAGLGQRDERVADQIAMLSGARAKRLLVLNATADGETLDHVITRFADREFAGCVVTKVDEAARLAPVIDAVIRHRLTIHYVADGQRVPEDLQQPNAGSLVHRALSRPAVNAAFALHDDDEPAWLAAMAERSSPLSGITMQPGSLTMPAAIDATPVHASLTNAMPATFDRRAAA